MYKYVALVFVLLAIAYLVLRDRRPVEATARGLVAAPLEVVWRTQTDIRHWQSWNKDIESMDVRGEVGVGTVFVWKAGGITIESRVIEFEPHRRIAWEGKTLGIRAHHIWEFSETAEGTAVTTHEEFKGPLPWLLPGTMRKEISKALHHGVEVLKAECERAAS